MNNKEKLYLVKLAGSTSPRGMRLLRGRKDAIKADPIPDKQIPEVANELSRAMTEDDPAYAPHKGKPSGSFRYRESASYGNPGGRPRLLPSFFKERAVADEVTARGMGMGPKVEDDIIQSNLSLDNAEAGHANALDNSFKKKPPRIRK